jgi:uncharacterized tellurite resistance protein B-like protein
MLLDAIRSMFSRASGQPATSTAAQREETPLHIAACALLLDVAWADGEFSAVERAHVEETLARHFNLTPEEGHEVIAMAEVERRKAVDHFQFTRVLKEQYDLGQKMVLAEVLWGLVLADGTIAEHEHYLARKIANLLDLEPGYLSTAKANAERKATATDH